MTIQAISTEVEYLTTNVGYIKVAYLVINGIKHLYDSVSILVKDKMTNEVIEENDKKDLEFKRIQTRLKMIIQDIIEKAQLCHQKNNKIEIEKPKMLKEEREDNAKEIVKKIKEYCEFKLVNFSDKESEVTMTTYYSMIDILNIINPDKDIRDRVKQICGISKSEPEDDPLDALR
jgi:hypothetical protein